MAKQSYTKEQADQFFEAISEDDVDSIKGMLEEYPDLVSAGKGSCKQTPLHMAAREGHCKVAEALLSAEADAMKKDIMGYTPHDFADAKHGKNSRIAQALQPGLYIKPAKSVSYVQQQAAREVEAAVSQDSGLGSP